MTFIRNFEKIENFFRIFSRGQIKKFLCKAGETFMKLVQTCISAFRCNRNASSYIVNQNN